MLNILEGFDLKATGGAGSAGALHLMSETMKMAYADRYRYLGDSDFVKMPLGGMTSKAYGAERARQIDPTRAQPAKTLGVGDPWKFESPNTTHYSVADAAGNVVSTTYTLGADFGSGVMVAGAGFVLNNQMNNFSHEAAYEAREAKTPPPPKPVQPVLTPPITPQPPTPATSEPPAVLAAPTAAPTAPAVQAAPPAPPPPPAPPAPPPSAPSAPPKVELPSSKADYLHNPPPDYPRMSKRLGEQGRVVVKVLIGEDGRAQKVELLTTSGFERLDKSAMEAAMRWRYVPGKRGGVAEAMWYQVPIQFTLE